MFIFYIQYLDGTRVEKTYKTMRQARMQFTRFGRGNDQTQVERYGWGQA